MLRPIYALGALAAIIGSATAEFVTLQVGNGNSIETIGADVIGASGSVTSYLIEEAQVTVVVSESGYYQSQTFPGGDYMSQECSVVTGSSVQCEVYESDADSGSTRVSTLPGSSLTDVGKFVLSISATKTDMHSQTATQTVTDSTTPSSATAQETGSQSSTSTGTPQESTSSGAAAHLAMDGLWIGSSFAALLAAF